MNRVIPQRRRHALAIQTDGKRCLSLRDFRTSVATELTRHLCHPRLPPSLLGRRIAAVVTAKAEERNARLSSPVRRRARVHARVRRQTAERQVGMPDRRLGGKQEQYQRPR
jgi:hypothetical protein